MFFCAVVLCAFSIFSGAPMHIAVGCSNWKRMFAVLQNLTEPTNPRLRPPESILSGVDNLYQLSPSEREERLRSYFKFVMIRNPLERIVSVYRNKVSVFWHAYLGMELY